MCFEDDLLNVLIVGNVETKSFDVFKFAHRSSVLIMLRATRSLSE